MSKDDLKAPPMMTKTASRAAAAQFRAALRRRGILSPKFRGSSRICRTCVKEGVRIRAPLDIHADVYIEVLGDSPESKITRTLRLTALVREAAAECRLTYMGRENLTHMVWRLAPEVQTQGV